VRTPRICWAFLRTEHRGRSFNLWAWIAVVIGPLALPLVFLFRNRISNQDTTHLGAVQSPEPLLNRYIIPVLDRACGRGILVH
jgi:hypothetical protein